MLALTMILVTTLVTGGHTDGPLPRRISGPRAEPAEGSIAFGGVHPVLVGGASRSSRSGNGGWNTNSSKRGPPARGSPTSATA
jgi:hypothetical protein